MSGESGFLTNSFWGRCPGCNPPSVLSSICLIGEPAPPAEDHRRLLPLSHRCRDPFHPRPDSPQSSPGEGRSSSSPTDVGGVSSRPRPWPCNCSPARRLSQRNDHVPCRELLNMISLRTWTPHGPNTLCDWGSRAERLDRSLDAYTPIPSTPSSMGALVTVPQRRHRHWNSLDWNGCLFSGEVSGLDAFSPYPR